MHKSAFTNAKLFFDSYLSYIEKATVIETGSQNINGSIRDVTPPVSEFIGVDFVKGRGVDIILDDPYTLPFENKVADVVVSSSCFEHSEMFWLLFSEAVRILKDHGVFYLNVPSTGNYHKYPADCWRFYPDSGKALETWAVRSGFNCMLLESYISGKTGSHWNDCVSVFLKDRKFIRKYPRRILDDNRDVINGYMINGNGQINPSKIIKVFW